MSRYIDADVFIKNLKTNEHGDTDVNQVEIAIDKSRADVVEVVRCKDCVKRHDGCPMQVWCGTSDDDYCSRGVRDD